MKFGCGAQLHELALVKELGYEYVELRGGVIAALSEADFQTVVETLHALELPCLGLNAYCAPNIVMLGPDYDRTVAKSYAKHVAKRAQQLGVVKMGIGSPKARQVPAGYDLTLAMEQARGFVADTAEVFGQVGIAIGFEPLGPCYSNFINTMEQGLALIEPLRAYGVGLVPDFYNMEQSGEGDLDLTPYQPMMVHAHISDDLGTYTQRSHLLEEKFPLHQQRLKRLMDTGYDDTLTLEIDIPITQEMGKTLAFLRGI